MRLSSYIFAFSAFLFIIFADVRDGTCNPNPLAISPEIRAQINQSISSALNGLVILSSSTAFGSGYFTVREAEAKDTEIDVVRLLNDFYLEEQGSAAVVPYVKAGVGYLRQREHIPPLEGSGTDDFSKINNTSVFAGGGAELRVATGLFVTSGMEVIYSRTGNSYDYNNEFSKEFLSAYNTDIFGWEVDTLSYTPQVGVRYETTTAFARIMPSLSYTQVFLDSLETESATIEANTSSGVINAKLRAEFPSSLCAAGGEVYITPQVSRTDVFRDAREGLGFNHYHDVSIGLLAKNQNLLPVFTDVGIMAGYSFATDVTGWRMGLEANF